MKAPRYLVLAALVLLAACGSERITGPVRQAPDQVREDDGLGYLGGVGRSLAADCAADCPALAGAGGME